jgi:FkbM family methyltransferase
MTPTSLPSRIRASLDRAFLRFVRLYTYYTPLAKGKYRLQTIAAGMCRYLPDNVEVPTRDGRRLFANLSTGMETTLYFLGEYERDITEKVVTLIREGDVCLDVGANFGWYTTLFRKVCGNTGAVHSFEPVPSIFAELEANYELMGSPANVFLNNLALGDEEKTITVNLFEGLSTGHASLSTQGRDDAVSFDCRMITLDSYLEENDIRHVDIVKVDIEGAEMMFLRGASRLFEQETPPIVLMEMALGQTKNFGYEPNDLTRFIAARADYAFYAVDEMTREVKKIDGFPDAHIGANVFCIPRGRLSERPDWLPENNAKARA